MTPTTFWLLISVIAVAGISVGIGVGIGKSLSNGKARTKAPRAQAKATGAQSEHVHVIPTPCRLNGHAYKEYDTGWRCATCGNHVPRRDGELYGLVADGRHERRREPR